MLMVARDQAFQGLLCAGGIAAVDRSIERPVRTDCPAHGGKLFQAPVVEGALVITKAIIGPAGFGVANQIEVFHPCP